jgi:hypothetical protein
MSSQNLPRAVILQITLIASWFDDINRVADALGWEESSEKPANGCDRAIVRPLSRFAI